MNKHQIKHRDKEILEIAKGTLGLETLEVRNMDSLDFHDLGIVSIKQALEEAYKAGFEHATGVHIVDVENIKVDLEKAVESVVGPLEDRIKSLYKEVGINGEKRK